MSSFLIWTFFILSSNYLNFICDIFNNAWRLLVIVGSEVVNNYDYSTVATIVYTGWPKEV